MNRYITLILILVPFLYSSCKKEDEILDVNLEMLCQDWVLKKITYSSEGNKDTSWTPYYDIKLSMKNGGRYELSDEWNVINMKKPNGTGITSDDVQSKYGLWEFTNESKADQIVFNKGANTYSLWNESGTYDVFYVFSDPEYVYKYKVDENTLSLTTNDYNLIYMYGFYIAYDDAYYYSVEDNMVMNNFADGYNDGSYYGQAGGYNDGALQIYNETGQSLDIYKKDPFFNGVADGKLQHYRDKNYGDLDLTPYPDYSFEYNTAYSTEYDAAYDIAYSKKSKGTDPGMVTLVFERQ